MEIKLASIFFAVFHCVHLCQCHKWIIMEDVGLEHEYSEILNSSLKTVKNVLTDLSDLDEFYKKSPEELSDICSQLKNSPVYQRVPLMMQFPNPKTILEDDVPKADQTEDEFVYALRPVQSYPGPVKGKIAAFPCHTHRDRKYWLTYGYAAERIFLLREWDGSKELSFAGTAEIVPRLDDNYPEGQLLDEYFRRVHMGFHMQERKHVNPFASSAMFRLCCLVNAVREEGESYPINYVNSDLDSVYNRFNVEHALPLIQKENTLRAVGCVVNRQSYNEIAFYVNSNEDDPNSVFVLNPVEKDSGERKLRVAQVIRDLHFSARYSTYGL